MSSLVILSLPTVVSFIFFVGLILSHNKIHELRIMDYDFFLSCLLFNRTYRSAKLEVGAHALDDPFALLALKGPVEAS
jgi:hypothetical protein